MQLEKKANLPRPFKEWFKRKGWKPHPHQLAMLEADRKGASVLLIAPTGGGKTLAGFLPTLVALFENNTAGLHTLYISPLKALASDIERNLMVPITEMGLSITVEMRTGDTTSHRRTRQLKKPPHILLTTPESLELMLSYADAARVMSGVKRVIVDEIHALAPGKRGHLTALCLTRLKALSPEMRVCGLSATVSEPERLLDWIGNGARLIEAESAAKPEIALLATESRVPWSGYAASYAVGDIYEAIAKAGTTIVFVNTRAQAELMFQFLWQANAKNLSIALHHGSLERDHRRKIESAMSRGELRAIVATASLDLGLDWGAVDQVIQVGTPKGISRLLQRIGRSNHRLDVPSEALLVPCNRFDTIECVAMMDAIDEGLIDGEPMMPGTLDVLAQFVLNSACGEGFDPDELFAQITGSAAYRHITPEAFTRVVRFVADGGYALKTYERFHRIALNETGRWVATPVAVKRHRMNIGTIVEYETLPVTVRRSGAKNAKPLGRIEEYFVQGLTPGDSFVFAGRLLRYKGIRENRVEAEPASGTIPRIPSFKGGRLPLSESLAERVCELIEHPEQWHRLPPLTREWLDLQQTRSLLPSQAAILAETFPHQRMEYLAYYTFAGRNANQTLGLLVSLAMEEARLLPLGFVANDYVLMLWGLAPVGDPAALLSKALSQQNSGHWIETSQISRGAFRDVAIIAGLVERRLPGKQKTGRQVTISTDLIYDVLRKYEPDHILLHATRQDVLAKLSDLNRLNATLSGKPVNHKRLERVSPLAVPLVLEIGIQKVKGEGESELLSFAAREAQADRLLKAGA